MSRYYWEICIIELETFKLKNITEIRYFSLTFVIKMKRSQEVIFSEGILSMYM